MVDRKIRPAHNGGFLLVEVLMALLIIALTVAAFSSLFVYSVQGIFTSGYKTGGLYEAQEIMEKALETFFAENPAAALQQLKDNLPVGQEIVIGTETKINEVTGQVITVNVQYSNARGATQTVTLKSFLPN